MVSFVGYVSLTVALTATVVVHAFYTRKHYYPAIVYLVNSKIGVMTMWNQGLALLLIFCRMVRALFLGRLRDVEVDNLYDRAWYAITEICLAMTIFREEFNTQFVAMFASFLCLKVFHWLCSDRIDFIEQSPQVNKCVHFRILFLMLLLLAGDCTFLYIAGLDTITRGTSVLTLFAFEYLILASTILSLYVKYALHMIDHTMDGWENKGMWTFYLELVTDLFQLLVYMVFFVMIYTNYGLPLHIVRDIWMTFRTFRERVAVFVRYRRTTRNMNERFPDATPEEIEQYGNECVICREEMTVAKKLACNHLFHFTCLRSWMERQKSCPTCRTDIRAPPRTPSRPAPAPTPSAGASNGGGSARPNVQGSNTNSDSGEQPRVPTSEQAPATPVAANMPSTQAYNTPLQGTSTLQTPQPYNTPLHPAMPSTPDVATPASTAGGSMFALSPTSPMPMQMGGMPGMGMPMMGGWGPMMAPIPTPLPGMTEDEVDASMRSYLDMVKAQNQLQMEMVQLQVLQMQQMYAANAQGMAPSPMQQQTSDAKTTNAQESSPLSNTPAASTLTPQTVSQRVETPEEEELRKRRLQRFSGEMD